MLPKPTVLPARHTWSDLVPSKSPWIYEHEYPAFENREGWGSRAVLAEAAHAPGVRADSGVAWMDHLRRKSVSRFDSVN